jgi:PadR family transcriptional regulator, regulatory protein AphA
MSRPELSPVSYVVLGLVARDGPSTPYALKAAVARGIAQFWAFPHSQIYAETDRLARMGLLAEERESGGRRRRSYRITDAGRAALASWLAEPTGEAPQIRSLALLKLFFGQFASEADIAALARAQLETQRRRLEVFRGLIERLEARGDRPWQLEVAHLLHQAELSFASSWTRISELVEERPDAAGASG